MLKNFFRCVSAGAMVLVGCGSGASSSSDGSIGISKTDQCNAVVDRLNAGLNFEGRPAASADQRANQAKKDAESYRKLAAAIGELKIVHPDLKGVVDEYVKVLGTRAETSDALAIALTSLDEATIAAAEKKSRCLCRKREEGGRAP